jgi:hypothetical protein
MRPFPPRIAWLLAIALIAAAGVLHAAPRILVTVDVESNGSFTLPQQLDARCSDGTSCGLSEVVGMLRERNAAGTFFLNVYEHPTWGKPAMRDIARTLEAQGQDVELHTHPETAYDPKRSEMYDYSVVEQTRIIAEGAALLSEWTGKPVVAHRAGDYSADRNTLLALASAGIRLDSSLFWGHPRSRLNELGLPHNLPSVSNGVTEIPVTVYERVEQPGFFSAVLPSASTVRKVDVDWFLSVAEAKAAFDALLAVDPPCIVVFLHSFSFMDKAPGSGPPVVDQRARAVFSALLDRIAERRLEMVTMRQIAGTDVASASLHRQDVVPRVTVQAETQRVLWHWLHGQPNRTWSALALLALAGAAAVLVLAAIRRRARHHRRAA